MRLLIEGNTIEKKAYMGRRDLTEVWVPAHVKRIESWAFAHCDRLRLLELPSGIEYIGKDVFLGCSALDRVMVYGAETMERFSEPELVCVSKMTATALRHFDAGNTDGFTGIGSPEWILAWDTACARYIESADDRGFMPFLSGGEEDYEDASHMRQMYQYETRREKIRVLFHRLSAKDVFPADENLHRIWSAFFKRVSVDDRMLFQDGNRDRKSSGYGVLADALIADTEHLRENFRICADENLFDLNFVEKLIATLSEEYVELRAMLIQYIQTSGMEKNIWKEFLL